MPRKKERKPAEKQEEGRKAAGGERRAESGGPEATEADFYRIQNRYLTEQLESVQLRCDELTRQNKGLTSQYATLEKEKEDRVDYLKRSLFEKEAEVDELSECLEKERQAAGQERDAMHLQHSQTRLELEDRSQKLSQANKSLVARLASLEEFQTQKDKLMADMACLEEQLASQKEEHKHHLHSLEMKGLREKKRLEEELEKQVAAIAAEVQQQVNEKLSETTRSTLQKNQELNARSAQLSQLLRVLTEENSVLRERRSQLSIDLEILEKTLRETSRTSCIRKRVVEQLTGKCEQLQAEQQDWKQQLQPLQDQHTTVLEEREETLRKVRASRTEQSHKTQAPVSQQEAELQEERRRSRRMKSTMQEAAVALQKAIMEVPTQQDPDLDSVVQWQQHMLELLAFWETRLRSGSITEDERLNEKPRSDR